MLIYWCNGFVCFLFFFTSHLMLSCVSLCRPHHLVGHIWVCFKLTWNVVPGSLWDGASSVRPSVHPSTNTCNFFSETTQTISMKLDHNLQHSWCTKVFITPLKISGSMGRGVLVSVRGGSCLVLKIAAFMGPPPQMLITQSGVRSQSWRFTPRIVVGSM